MSESDSESLLCFELGRLATRPTDAPLVALLRARPPSR